MTDLGSDRIKLHGNSGVQDVSVYAFQTKFDDQLSWSQRRRRRRLRSLIERMSHLIGDTAQPYRPGRIVVLEQSTRPSSEPATFTWPGPDPSVFLHASTTAGRQSTACGEITGEQARTVYQAAMANAGQRWLVQGRTRLLAVNPLPIEIDC